MLKTYQFKTNCKGDSHSSKTANVILPGLVTKHWQNDICSFRAMTVALAVSFKVISFYHLYFIIIIIYCD